MILLSFDYEGHPFSLDLNLDQRLVSLTLDDIVVSVKPFSMSSVHEFHHADFAVSSINFEFDLANQTAHYQLMQAERAIVQGTARFTEEACAFFAQPDALFAPSPITSGSKWSGVVLLGVGIKLFKTIKVFKLALAAATVAVYSVMFTVEFALALIGGLVFHEYGHLRAMKRFGIPTKGMYLIPFVGGIAVGDRPQTQWQSVYISMMGPVFGLLLTAVFYVIFLVTGSHFCGLVASTSALLNLFNLFPVHPLDGGQVVKALVFSRRNYVGLVTLLVISALCLVLSWKLGFAFISFFIVLGVVDIVSGWSVPLSKDITPLNANGIWFCIAWYLLVVLAFLALILLIVDAGVPGAEIATKILKS
jgi:putative peptide zinc metalloprotease protein